MTTRDRLAALSPEQRRTILAGLTPEQLQELSYSWKFWAREAQLPPEGRDWRCWVLQGGRGAGKTKTAAETIRADVEAGRRRSDRCHGHDGGHRSARHGPWVRRGCSRSARRGTSPSIEAGHGPRAWAERRRRALAHGRGTEPRTRAEPRHDVARRADQLLRPRRGMERQPDGATNTRTAWRPAGVHHHHDAAIGPGLQAHSGVCRPPS